MEDRYDRQEMIFGEAGQERIATSRVAIVGVGGLGSHLAQQLAYLGVRFFSVLDGDVVTISSLNRLIGATLSDVGELKVKVVAQTIRLIQPEASVDSVPHNFISVDGYSALCRADWVFGCVDNDASRLVLNEYCQAYERPYFDLASDVFPRERSFGGRILFANGQICVICKDLIDQRAVHDAVSTQGQLTDDTRIYGIRRDALGETGPSVVTLNGVIASLAATEFMVEVTGLRAANTYLEYRGNQGVVYRSSEVTGTDCYYCKTKRGQKERADVERFIRESWGDKLDR